MYVQGLWVRIGGCSRDYDLAYGNHEEADTRVWLHASVSSADQVIIYSPDTDVFFMYFRKTSKNVFLPKPLK
jgi:hypothetical protein